MRADFFYNPDQALQEGHPAALTPEYELYESAIVEAITKSELPVLLCDPRIDIDGTDRTSGFVSEVTRLFDDDSRFRTGEIFHDERYVMSPFVSTTQISRFTRFLDESKYRSGCCAWIVLW